MSPSSTFSIAFLGPAILARIPGRPRDLRGPRPRRSLGRGSSNPSMRHAPVTPDDDADPRSRPERLAAYYALLILFLYLPSKLLQTLAGLYNLQQFEKLHEIAKMAL